MTCVEHGTHDLRRLGLALARVERILHTVLLTVLHTVLLIGKAKIAGGHQNQKELT
jgi:hypothetical protein